jgi:CheY-like chemotaxis protein
MKSDSRSTGPHPGQPTAARELPQRKAIDVAPEPERKRILIVDRDADALSGLAYLIESMGYEAQATRDVNEALSFAQEQLPDAAFIDIGGPQLEGLSVARRLREIAGTRPLLLIALTGWGQPQYRDMAMAAGYDVHWVKPIGADQLNFLLSMTLV